MYRRSNRGWTPAWYNGSAQSGFIVSQLPLWDTLHAPAFFKGRDEVSLTGVYTVLLLSDTSAVQPHRINVFNLPTDRVLRALAKSHLDCPDDVRESDVYHIKYRRCF